MTTRIRDENNIHAPNHGRKLLKKGNENTLSITRPTLASSAKAKPELKPKGSRTVLAPLSKSNPNATPRSKSDTADKPKSLTSKVTVKQSILQTPKPVKKVLPKSTKKTINIYTPARPVKTEGKGHNEVEHSHPKPPEDGPPTPIRNAMFAAADVMEDDIPPPPEDLVWEDDFGLHFDNPVSPPRPLS